MTHPTLAFVLRRLIHGIPVVLIVAVGVFFILEAAPGDAVDAYLVSVGGGDLALAEQLRQQWGLDQSVRRPLPGLHAVGGDARPGLVVGGGHARDPGHPASAADHDPAHGRRHRDVGGAGHPPGRHRRDASRRPRRPAHHHERPGPQRDPGLLAGPHPHRRVRGLAGLVPERGPVDHQRPHRPAGPQPGHRRGTWCCR